MRTHSVILTALIIVLSMTSVGAQQHVSAEDMDKSKVCMVDDVFKGEPQLKTTVDGKVFYGCCEPCIEALDTDASFRYAIDPLSGSEVCKADAYVARKPGGQDAVLYFGLRENYRRFLVAEESR